MLAYKISGALLLIICGSFTGRILCKNSEAALEITEGFIALLKYIRNQIDFYLMPVDRILAVCPSEILDSCAAVAGASTFYELLQSLNRKLPPSISDILYKYAAELGTTYRDSQLKICDYYIGKLISERDRIKTELPDRRKMIMTLCICSTTGIAIIMF